MIDPRVLAFSVTDPGGFISRWGGDEPDAFDVPAGIGFTTKIPGGFNTCNVVLPRPIDRDFPDLLRFSPVDVYGQGGLPAFEGYISEAPRSHGDSFSATPGIVGWAAHLRDDPSFREIYIDRELARWIEPSPLRKRNTAGLRDSGPQINAEVAADLGSGVALRQAITPPWVANVRAEAWYDALGIAIGSVYYEWLTGNTAGEVNSGDAAYEWYVVTRSDESGTQVSVTADLQTSGATGTGTLTGGATAVFATVHMLYTGAFSADTSTRALRWPSLYVFGNNGLTKQGSGTSQGFYASDVIANIVSRTAPLLNYSTGEGGSIQPTSFIIPQLAFMELTTGEDAILETNRFELNDWGVYERKTFFYRPQGTGGRVWRLRVGDGVKVEEEGPQIETSFNGVVVGYQDAAGRNRFVGPTGFTGGTAYAELADTSSTNPVNAFGRKKWARIDMGLTTESGAVQVGYLFMQEIATRKTRGSVVVTGTAKDSNGVTWPAWYMRAGDRVVLEDTNDTAERIIVDSSYTHDSLELTANLDAPANKLDALLERLDVVLVNI